MYDHDNVNNRDDGHKGMMWMMIPCLLLLGVLFLGGGKLASFNYLWLIMLGVCVVPHLWMMFKGHGSHKVHGDNNTEDKIDLSAETAVQAGGTSAKQSETRDGHNKHKNGGCCH